MLTRMVSICWPRDPPALASQSVFGITDVSDWAWPALTNFFTLVLFKFSVSLTHSSTVALMLRRPSHYLAAIFFFPSLSSARFSRDPPTFFSQVFSDPWVEVHLGVFTKDFSELLLFLLCTWSVNQLHDLFYLFIFKTGFHHVGQAGLELPTSGDPPALASKVLGLQAWATMPCLIVVFFMTFNW